MEGTLTVGPREPVPLGSAGRKKGKGWVKRCPFSDGVGISVCRDGSGSRRGGGWGSEAERRGPGVEGRAWAGGGNQPAGTTMSGDQAGLGLGPATVSVSRVHERLASGPRHRPHAPQIGRLPSARRTRRAKPRSPPGGSAGAGGRETPHRRELRRAGPVANSRSRGASPWWHLWSGASGPRHTSTACPEGSAGARGCAGRPGRPVPHPRVLTGAACLPTARLRQKHAGILSRGQQPQELHLPVLRGGCPTSSARG